MSNRDPPDVANFLAESVPLAGAAPSNASKFVGTTSRSEAPPRVRRPGAYDFPSCAREGWVETKFFSTDFHHCGRFAFLVV